MKFESPMTTRRGLRLEFFTPRSLTHESELPIRSGSRELSEQEVNAMLLRRHALAGQFFGRWQLRMEMAWDRMLWCCWVDGARIVKRTFDIFASLLSLMLLSPMFLLIALLVRLEDGGPVFFAQTRVGRYGQEFKMFKVRSMCHDAEARWAALVSQN